MSESPRLRRAKTKRTIGGQQLFDEPWHCSWCGFPYLRRNLHGFWDEVRRGATTYLRWTVLRICVTRPQTKDKEAEVGCAEMGFERLLNGVKRRDAMR